jgi:hypothetical protein
MAILSLFLSLNVLPTVSGCTFFSLHILHISLSCPLDNGKDSVDFTLRALILHKILEARNSQRKDQQKNKKLKVFDLVRRWLRTDLIYLSNGHALAPPLLRY